ncbi:MAG: caspase family protein [Planctomycetaceae bacterium]|jgi:uncharacterized caspase-like protein|nr:caspase family protein [Planctomycetaceae bacterium]
MTNQFFFQKRVILPFIFLFVVFNAAIGYSVPKPNIPDSGTGYALLIGVNDYDNDGNKARAKEANRPFFNLPNLNYCCNDMIGIGEALVSGQFTKQENIVILTSNAKDDDKKPTLVNIDRELKNLLAKLKPVDTVFIAFSGSGCVLPDYEGDEKGELYLCPMDAEIFCSPKTGKFDCRRLISRNDIVTQLQDSEAGIKIFVMDTCRNRDIVTRSIAQTELVEKTTLEFFPVFVKGCLFQLFSCAEEQTGAESAELEHGIYSYFMIKGLKGAANSNNDRYISLSELQRYIQKMTSDYAKEVLKHEQTPKIVAICDRIGEDIVITRLISPPLPNGNIRPVIPPNRRTR